MRFNIRKERSIPLEVIQICGKLGMRPEHFGSYKALKIVSPGTYPMTIAVTADGYEDVTFKVTKDTSSYPYTYTATVVSTPSGEKNLYGNCGSSHKWYRQLKCNGRDSGRSNGYCNSYTGCRI